MLQMIKVPTIMVETMIVEKMMVAIRRIR